MAENNKWFNPKGALKALKAATNRKNTFKIKKIPIAVLEIEDLCYHEGSALILPDTPAGTNEGESSDENQKRVSGVASLALVYRQFEEDPNKKLLIAGFDDSNGTAKQGFIISKERANGALMLIKGEKTLWAKHAHDVHIVKDYQQILKYYCHEHGYDCDPGEIDNIWGPKTKGATNNFFRGIVSNGTSPKPLNVNDVVSSNEKKWPVDAWEAVFSLYESSFFSLLIGSRWTPDDAKKARASLKFVDDSKPYVACGESFPASFFGATNFRSQKDRRVEFLFFDAHELPAVPIKCPAQIDTNHTKAECPLHSNLFYLRSYIPPSNIYSVLYHLKFEYFNRVKNEVCGVPIGLNIESAKGWSPSLVTCTSKNGIYEVRVINILNQKRSKDVTFSFNTASAWIYTKDKNTDPKIVYKFSDVDPSLPNLPITRAELAKKTVAEQFCYYDLPEKWDSTNWICKIDQKSDEFKNLVDKITSTTSPMTFCLDDIALIDAAGSQDIKDKNKTNVAKALDADSRVSLYHVKKEKLELYSPEDANAPYFSKIDFAKNRISNPPAKSSVIAFANDFYTVNNLRTGGACDYAKGQLLGARAAKINDSSKHFGEVLDDNNNTFGHQLFFASATGNYQLHYFHGLDIVEKSGNQIPLSFLMIYWSARFKLISTPAKPVTANELKTFATKGMLNSKERWEHKGYTIEPNSNAADRNIIKPVFLFEGKKADSGGKEICEVTIVNDTDSGVMGNATSEMHKEDYKIRNYLNMGKHIDIDGKAYETLVVAHEFGHATGKDDEYAYDDGDIAAGWRNAQDGVFTQYYPGMPYYVDEGSMMYKCGAPRMKQYWFFVNWLNERAKLAGHLKTFLNDEQYKIVHRYKNKTLNYFLPSTPVDYRNIYKPAHFQRAVNTGTGTFDLSIYKLGEDETAYALEVGNKLPQNPWDCICVIYVKIGVKFDYDKNAAGANVYKRNASGAEIKWNNLAKTRWLNSLENKLNLVKKKYYIKDTAAGNQNFKNGYIYFYPIVLEDPFDDPHNNDALGNPVKINISGVTNYNIIVNLNKTANVGTRGGNTLQVGDKTHSSWIVKYLFGSDDGTAAPNRAVSVNKNNFKTVRDWLRGKLSFPTLTIEKK